VTKSDTPSGWMGDDAGEEQSENPSSDDEDLEEQGRRAKIRRSIRQGLTVPEIAKIHSIPLSVVQSDIRALKKATREEILNAEGYDELGDAVEALREIESLALLEMIGARAGSSERNACLRTALQARKERTTLLQDAGIIPKVADKLDIQAIVGILELPTDQLEEKRKEIVRRLQMVDEIENAPIDE